MENSHSHITPNGISVFTLNMSIWIASTFDEIFWTFMSGLLKGVLGLIPAFTTYVFYIGLKRNMFLRWILSCPLYRNIIRIMIPPHGRQRSSIYHCQWWPVDPVDQGISIHDIDTLLRYRPSSPRCDLENQRVCGQRRNPLPFLWKIVI